MHFPNSSLPLSDSAAHALLVALADSASATSRSLIAATLRRDPPLAVWSRERALADRQRLETADQAAGYLLARGHLGWTAASDPPALATRSREECEQLARRAATDVRIAALAAQVATQRGLCAEGAWYAALVSRAPFWHASPSRTAPPVGPGTASADEESGRAGLSAELTECVAAAERLSARSFGDGGSLRPDFASAEEEAVQAARHWSYPASPVTGALPQLLARLSGEARAGALAAGTSDEATSLAQQKLAALAEFAAGAGHELNNPLANIAGRAQLLARSVSPNLKRDLAVIHAQAMRAHEMISGLMLFARPPASRLIAVDPDELLAQVTRRFAPLAEARSVALQRLPADVAASGVHLFGDAAQLAVALAALVDNALTAVSRGGRVKLGWTVEARTPPLCTLFVEDDGPGMPAEVLAHAFDPFFSGRPAGRGLGVGLCKVARIAELHGGRAELESLPGGGSRATLRLPLT